MVICDNCNVIVMKNSFCSTKCRVAHFRSNESVTKDTINIPEEVEDTNSVPIPKFISKHAGLVDNWAKTTEILERNVPSQVKKKIDKNGQCPHFIKAEGYCAKCEKE